MGRPRKDLGRSPGSTESFSHITFLFRSVLIVLLKQFHSNTNPSPVRPETREDSGQTEGRMSRYYLDKGSKAIDDAEHFSQRKY